jgi:hypothetical protein
VIEQREIIRWESPGPARNGPQHEHDAPRSSFDEIASELRANPKRPAVIAEYKTKGTASSLARYVRMGGMGCFYPAGDFEACSRRQLSGIYSVYAWYTGDGETS